MDHLLILTHFAIVLLLGLFCTLIANKFRISNILLLILTGIFLGKITYQGSDLFSFTPEMVTSIGILALVMITFDGSSRFKLREFDELSLAALKLSGVFILMNLIFLSLAVKLMFGIQTTFLAVIFAFVLSGTSPSAVLTIFKDKTSRVIQFLEIESILNTPMVVLLPFIVADLMTSIKTDFISKFIEQITPFIAQIVVGIGSGILIGFIVFKVMKREYSEQLSPLALFIAALLTYVIAENLGGNGVLAVATLGLFFGSVYVKQKAQLMEFSTLLSNILEILIFIFVGMIINIEFSSVFILKSSILFLFYVLLRYAAVMISLSQKPYTQKEKIFMTLNMPKGISVAVVALILQTREIPGMEQILDLLLIFMIYSLVLSIVSTKFAGFFIEFKEVEKDAS